MVLFADAGHLEDGGLMSQRPSLPLRGCRGFYKEGKGNRAKRSWERVAMFSKCRVAQSVLIQLVMCLILASCHPGFMHSGIHVEGQQTSQSWDD